MSRKGGRVCFMIVNQIWKEEETPDDAIIKTTNKNKYLDLLGLNDVKETGKREEMGEQNKELVIITCREWKT